MPALPKITIYTNDGTTVLGSINLSNVGQEGYPAYINDSGISPTTTAADGYIYMMVLANGLAFLQAQIQQQPNMDRVRLFSFHAALMYMP